MKIKTTRATIDIKFFCDNSNPSFCAKKKTLYPQWMQGFSLYTNAFLDFLTSENRILKPL